MIFWDVKCLLEILLLCGSRHVLVGVGVEEERVRSPREGFGTNIEVIVIRRKREVAIVLGLEVFQMLSVFSLNLLHPEVASPNCGETNIEADLTPEVGGVYGMMFHGFAFCGPLFGSSVYNDGAG